MLVKSCVVDASLWLVHILTNVLVYFLCIYFSVCETEFVLYPHFRLVILGLSHQGYFVDEENIPRFFSSITVDLNCASCFSFHCLI